MPVTHRPLLARAPKPVRSPESRWPQGLEILVSGSYRSGYSARISRVSDGRLRSPQGCANRSPLSRSVSTLHQHRNPAAIVCANRVVTASAPAGSDDALNAPAIKGFRSLAQVTTPRDGLPDPSSSWTAQRGPSSCPLPRAQCNAAPRRRPSEPWVNGSLDGPTSNRTAPSTPMPRAAAASSKANGTNREWCPEPLVAPDTLRRSGRAATLTGQASHTSSRAKGRTKGATKGGKG